MKWTRNSILEIQLHAILFITALISLVAMLVKMLLCFPFFGFHVLIPSWGVPAPFHLSCMNMIGSTLGVLKLQGYKNYRPHTQNLQLTGSGEGL